jgi:hypothetical protein
MTPRSESDAIIVTQEHDVKRCVGLTADSVCHLRMPFFGHGSGKVGSMLVNSPSALSAPEEKAWAILSGGSVSSAQGCCHEHDPSIGSP